VRSDARGRFRAAVPLPGSASVRAIVLGQGDASAGRVRSVRVRREVAPLRVKVDETEAIAGRPITVSTTVRPARPGERVVIEGRRAGSGWRVLARAKAAVGGRVATRVAVPAGGTWSLRARADGGASLADGSGRAARLSVYGRNPHGIPAGADHYIVQAINEMKLYYYEDGRLRRVLPVVFGAPSTPTPSGRYRVYSKGAGPGPAFGPLVLWYHRGYGIHGTNQEYLLGRSWRYYSHGCTRNYNENIRWLWPRVPVGTPVLNIR
jgi:lipoprotein-anchoring transpeptidase ErfK/SrfK